MRQHFIKECGWTESQFRKIKDCAWFCAAVRLFKNGEELDCEYLGCCSYETEKEFYTRYISNYFADMVHTLAQNTKDAVLIAAVTQWREALRAKVSA